MTANCILIGNGSSSVITQGNVNVDNTGKISCYALGTTSIDISGHGDIRLNSTGNKWDIGVYA